MAFTAGHGLALTRASFGLYFIVDALKKTADGWLTDPDKMMQFLDKNMESTPATYATFLDGVVMPNAPIFSMLVVLGMWTAGISLLLGLFTRLGGIVGMWLVLNFMLAKGLLNGEGSNDRLFFAACFAFAAAAAGLVWGLDGALRPTFEHNPVTRWLAGIPAPAARRLEALPELERRRERRAA
jgi:uncharacterized membrane protein YphA (DoxX/SURF4 family)